MASTSDIAYEKVCSMIYRGQLQPGDRLVEANLAARLGISHIPVRESLARLENEGLIRRVPNWATFVEEFSPVDALEMYSMRLMLEPTAARLAAVHADSSLPKQLQRLCEKMTVYQEAEDDANLDEMDYRFHLAIVHASRHKRLIRAYENCHIRVLSCHSKNLTPGLLAANSNARSHKHIIDHIAAKRPKAAERAAFEHVNKAMQLVESALGITLEELNPE